MFTTGIKKQISNSDHGHPKAHSYGEHGEHAHDYIYDDFGNLIGRPMRELNETERNESGDFFMTILEIKNHLSNLVGHITFVFNGYSCGIDPLSLDSFDMWYGDDEITVDSIEKVLNVKFFSGKSLTEIWNDVTDVDY